MAAFFIVVFAVLGIVVQGLGAARALQRPEPPMGYLVAQLVLTNSLEEGIEAGDFEEFAPDYHWETANHRRLVPMVCSKSIFWFFKSGTRQEGSLESMSILMHKPGRSAGL
jgi:hypothetical protein